MFPFYVFHNCSTKGVAEIPNKAFWSGISSDIGAGLSFVGSKVGLGSPSGTPYRQANFGSDSAGSGEKGGYGTL